MITYLINTQKKQICLSLSILSFLFCTSGHAGVAQHIGPAFSGDLISDSQVNGADIHQNLRGQHRKKAKEIPGFFLKRLFAEDAELAVEEQQRRHGPALFGNTKVLLKNALHSLYRKWLVSLKHINPFEFMMATCTGLFFGPINDANEATPNHGSLAFNPNWSGLAKTTPGGDDSASGNSENSNAGSAEPTGILAALADSEETVQKARKWPRSDLIPRSQWEEFLAKANSGSKKNTSVEDKEKFAWADPCNLCAMNFDCAMRQHGFEKKEIAAMRGFRLRLERMDNDLKRQPWKKADTSKRKRGDSVCPSALSISSASSANPAPVAGDLNDYEWLEDLASPFVPISFPATPAHTPGIASGQQPVTLQTWPEDSGLPELYPDLRDLDSDLQNLGPSLPELDPNLGNDFFSQLAKTANSFDSLPQAAPHPPSLLPELRREREARNIGRYPKPKPITVTESGGKLEHWFESLSQHDQNYLSGCFERLGFDKPCQGPEKNLVNTDFWKIVISYHAHNGTEKTALMFPWLSDIDIKKVQTHIPFKNLLESEKPKLLELIRNIQKSAQDKS